MPNLSGHTHAIDSLQQLTVEQLRCHHIDSEHRRVIPIPPDRLASDWQETSDEVWIDIQASHANEFQALLDGLQLHPLIMEDCLDPRRSSRFSSYENSLHFEVPVFHDDAADHYLSVICVPRMLITLRTSPIPEVDYVLQQVDQQGQLNADSKSALMYAIFDGLTGRLVEAAGDARAEIRRLSRTMDEKGEDVNVDDIISAKRNVQDIVSIAEDQLYCTSSLIPVDTHALSTSTQRDYFRDAARSYETALRVLHRYEARAAELHQQYLASLQGKTESRLRVLTVLSAIYLPLTLIAGIYGMNFSGMPELNVPWAYPATLALMVAIALGQMLFFKKHGWFG